MSKNSSFLKNLGNIDTKINSCIDEISNLFDGIENIDKELNILSSDEDVFEDFYNFLQTLDTLFSQSTNIAEFILPHWNELRRQNLMNLLKVSSLPLLDAVDTDSENGNPNNKITSLWKDISFKLEKYAFLYLADNYIPNFSLDNNFNLYQLKNCIFRLQSIFIPELVWVKYKSCRYQFLKNYNCPCPVEKSCFNCCLQMSIKCMHEDSFLVYMGSFHPHIVTQANIVETYMAVIDLSFNDLLKLLYDCLNCRNALPEKTVSVLMCWTPFYEKYSKTCLTCFFQNIVYSEFRFNVDWNHVDLSKNVFTHAIIKTIELILLFENQINSLFFNKENKYKMFHHHNAEHQNIIKDTKFCLPAESPEQSPFNKSSHEKLFNKSSVIEQKISVIWNWRKTIVESGYLSHLQKSLQNEVELVLRTSIEEEQNLMKSKDWKKLLISDPLHFTSTSVQMNALLLSVLNTVRVLEKYLTVLLTMCDSFVSFKSSFYHTLETYVIDLIPHLKQIASQNETFVIYYEYIVINNGVFLRDRLQNYCDAMKGSIHKCPQNNIFLSVNQLVNDVMESAYYRHYKYINCGILFDADSYNFEDQKPFFEGERISYSIQMWNLYMLGLHEELRYLLPQDIAQELYGRILADSLEHFLIRYSHCKPSEARTPQIMCDIQGLLLCASELLWPACSYVEHFIGSKQAMNESVIESSINKIHSSCCLLLSSLTVLTSPIISLRETFKDGFPQAQLSVLSKYDLVSPWLPWIRKELLSEFCQRQIMSSVSIWLATRVCTSWDLPNPAAIVKAYIEHNCTLSILLMMQAARSEDKDPLSVPKDSKIKLSYSLFELMISYNKSSSIQDILLPVIEKENGWEELDASAGNALLSNRSWWYIGLLKVMKPFYKYIIEDITPFWIDIQSKTSDPNAMKSWEDLKNNLNNIVVCLCEKDLLNTLEDEFDLSNEAISFLCLHKVLKSIQSNLVFLPLSLKSFLFSLDAHVKNYVPEIQPLKKSIPLQVLISGAIDCLRDSELISNVPDNSKNLTSVTVNALSSFLCGNDLNNSDENQIITELLSTIHEKFFDMKKISENSSKSTQFMGIQEETLQLTVHKLLHLPNGDDIILYLHKILKENISWIQKSLGVPTMLSTDIVVNHCCPSPIRPYNEIEQKESVSLHMQKENLESGNSENKRPVDIAINKTDSLDSGCSSKIFKEDPFNFIESTSNISPELSLNLEFDASISPPSFDFNPLEVFDMLGESSFTQIAKEQPQISWDSILSHLPILGLTEVNFCTLLSHRWDIRNEGPLSDEESSYVEELKVAYNVLR